VRKMIQGLHRLPPLRLLADPATQLTQPVVGDWCATAPQWNNPLLARRVACCALHMHGLVTLGHLLRASDLMAPPLTGPQFANRVRRAAFPVFTEAVGPLHAYRDRVARCLRQQPLPAWAVAARQCGCIWLLKTDEGPLSDSRHRCRARRSFDRQAAPGSWCGFWFCLQVVVMFVV